LAKNGSDANLAAGSIDMNTAPEDQKQAAKEFWEKLERESRENIK